MTSPQHTRLAASRDVRAVLAARRPRHGRAMVVHARARGDERPARVTVVAGRKVGGAVARNRAKRRLRAALRTVSLPAGVDVVVVAKADALREPWPRLVAEFARLTDAATAELTGPTALTDAVT